MAEPGNDRVGLGAILAAQRAAFVADGPPPPAVRHNRIDRLSALLLENTETFAEAMGADFGTRSRSASLFTEIIGILPLLEYTRSHTAKWMKPGRPMRGDRLLGLRAEVQPSPLGVAGIIGPWNFPVHLVVLPAAAAFAAGNRVMIKMSEITGHTEDLTEVGGADEDQIDIGHAGDLGDARQRRGGFDLNANERVFIGMFDVFWNWHETEHAIAVTAVDSALASGGKFGPADGLFGGLGGSDHADHHAVGARFQHAHDRGVVGCRQADEVVEAVGIRGKGRQFDLLHRQPGVLSVEPEAVKATLEADDLDELRRAELAGAEKANDLAGREPFFDSGHFGRNPGERRGVLSGRVLFLGGPALAATSA